MQFSLSSFQLENKYSFFIVAFLNQPGHISKLRRNVFPTNKAVEEGGIRIQNNCGGLGFGGAGIGILIGLSHTPG